MDIDIFSERNKILIEKDYKNFFDFDIEDIFFKDTLINIMISFNMPIYVKKSRYDHTEIRTNIIYKILLELTQYSRYFHKIKSTFENNNLELEKILASLKWEYLFDIIEIQYTELNKNDKTAIENASMKALLGEKIEKEKIYIGPKIDTEGEKFSKEINSFFERNKIPWFLEKGKINKRNKLIKRDYFYNLTGSENNGLIKLITGVRRSGKSKLLESFRDYLSETKINNVVFVDLELIENKELLDSNKLYNYVNEQFKNNKTRNYLIIDEIQKCTGFEKIISSLNKEKKFDIYLSGSNAFAFDGNFLVGRHDVLKIYPFSFKEFNTYFNYSKKSIDSFDEYIKKGGMSISYISENNKQIINKIYIGILEDIAKTFKLKENEKLLINKIANYLMDNIGKITSIKNITNLLLEKTNIETVNLYVNYLCKSFLFYPFQGYDVKGKEILLDFNKKYYLVDVSFRFANPDIGTKNMDYGKIYENIVAIELLRRGYEVYVGILKEKEIDFVAIKNGYKKYIQVSYNISDPETFKREVAPLLSISDGYPKIIIAGIKQPEYHYEGIRIIDISEWLNNNEK